MNSKDKDDALLWIQSQHDSMVRRLKDWAAINSYSYHRAGLERMADALTDEMRDLGTVKRIDLPPAQSIDSRGEIQRQELGQALRVIVNPSAQKRMLLNIHYDTVYPPESGFASTTQIDERTLRGPGVLDAKGGILVLLTAARALLRSPLAGKLAIEILLTPDEEIGSPGSGPLIVDAARRGKAALLFEPAFTDGWLVDSRRGSGNFVFIVRGRAAHAGRDFAAGRSAILAAANLTLRLSEDFVDKPGITINCGRFEGGGPLNVVPDLAIARFNARATTPREQEIVEQRIGEIIRETSQQDGIRVSVSGGFHAPPKILDARSKALLEAAIDCGRELGLTIGHRPSGGASDGNRIAAAGVPVVDSLGPVGGELHSEREYVLLPSLIKRAKLTTLLLMKIAVGRYNS